MLLVNYRSCATACRFIFTSDVKMLVFVYQNKDKRKVVMAT